MSSERESVKLREYMCYPGMYHEGVEMLECLDTTRKRVLISPTTSDKGRAED